MLTLTPDCIFRLPSVEQSTPRDPPQQQYGAVNQGYTAENTENSPNPFIRGPRLVLLLPHHVLVSRMLMYIYLSISPMTCRDDDHNKSYYKSSSVCLFVCLSVCLFVPYLLRGPLTDLRQTWWVYVGGPRNCP